MDLSLDNLYTLPMCKLSQFSGAALHDIHSQALQLYHEAEERKNWIEGAIQLKYEAQADAIRKKSGKDTGTIHFDDEDVHIKAELAKRVNWDQVKLGEIVELLKTNGRDVAEYITTIYKVSERKYMSWPRKVQNLFQPARTLKTAKPLFYLSKHTEAK